MKKIICYTTTALIATAALSFAAPDNDALKAKETAAWQAFKDKKADDFKKVVGAEMMAVYQDGAADMQKEMADMQKWDMKSFAISDYKVTMSGSDIAVSTYTVQLQGTVGGNDASGTYNCGSVWKQQNGDWHAIFHTNVPQRKS